MKKIIITLLLSTIFFQAFSQIGNLNPGVGTSIIPPGATATTATGCFLPLPTQTTGQFYFTYTSTGSNIVSSVTLSATSSGNTVTTVGPSTAVYFNGTNIYYNITLNTNATYCSSQILTLNLYKWNGSGYYLYCTKTQTVYCRDDSNDNMVQLNSGIYYVANDNTIDRMYWNGASWQYENIAPLYGWGTIKVDGWLAIDKDNMSFDKIYFKGKDGKVYNLFKSGSDWFVGVLNNAAVNASGCIRARTDGVYYIGTDAKVHHLYWSGSTWQYEAIAPSSGWTVTAQIDITIGSALVRGQSLELAAWPATNIFFRSNTNKIYNLVGSTGAWNLGQVSPTGAVDCAGEIITDNTGVYYKGTDNFIHRLYWSASVWNYDAMTTNNLSTANTAGQLAKISGENRVFYKGTDGALYNMYLSGSGWDVYPLSYTGGIVAGDIIANGNIYFIGTDNLIYNYWWGGSSWNLNALRYDVANAKGCSYNYRIPHSENNAQSENKFNVYPVPANDQLNIDFEADKETEVRVFIYNSLGQAVYDETMSVNGTTKETIMTDGLAEGQYLLIVVYPEGENKTHKFIIQH